MPRLIKRCSEYLPRERWGDVPNHTAGIYVLYRNIRGTERYDVAYVGMSGGGVRGRLREHNKWKAGWTHFSVFEVWDNIQKDEIKELEGLLRHIFAKDTKANKLAKHVKFNPFKRIRSDLATWKRRA